MKLAGGFLIGLALAVAWEVTTEFLLPVAANRGPFDWGGFLGYIWPCPIVLAIGILLWRRKPKNWLW
jgi:hypothetical protein